MLTRQPQTIPDQNPTEMVTPRAVVFGMICSLILGVADPYTNMIV